MTVGRIWSCVLMLKPINSIQISDSYKLYQESTLYCKRNKSLSNISGGGGGGGGALNKVLYEEALRQGSTPHPLKYH